MSSAARHRLARCAIALLMVAFALPGLDAPANPQHFDQARALVSGTVWIAAPTTTHDLARVGERWTSPFPPLPVAVAAVALAAGSHADLAYGLMVLAAALAALWLAGRLGDRLGGPASGTWAAVALGAGSGLLPATALHDTYHSAHVLAVAATLAALWLVLGRRRPFAGGLALGLAALARQAAVLAAPALAGLTGRRWRAGLAVAGAILPLVVYLALNLARFGSPFAAGYDLAEHLPHLKADVAAHGAFSLHWLPRNLGYLLGGLPKRVPVAPYLVPDVRGMALWLVSPWALAALLPLVRPDRPRARRLAAWCWLGAALAAIPSLLYVNTGYAQLGPRFALDFLPFLLLAAVLGVRRRPPLVPAALVGLAVAVHLWMLWAARSFAAWSPYLPP